MDSGLAKTSTMWWQGPKPSMLRAVCSDLVPVRPNPEPTTFNAMVFPLLPGTTLAEEMQYFSTTLQRRWLRPLPSTCRGGPPAGCKQRIGVSKSARRKGHHRRHPFLDVTAERLASRSPPDALDRSKKSEGRRS